MKYGRYTSRVELRIEDNYKKMLKDLSKAQKRGESEILRDIIEPLILRRHKKLKV